MSVIHIPGTEIPDGFQAFNIPQVTETRLRISDCDRCGLCYPHAVPGEGGCAMEPVCMAHRLLTTRT